jgi:hypothetical protein
MMALAGQSRCLKKQIGHGQQIFWHESTNERIALINQIYQTKTKVQVHDLTDAEGKLPERKWCWKY